MVKGEDNLRGLVNADKYQVFVLCCPASVPFNFASHSWFVCNELGKISRWEMLFIANEDKDWGHLHLDHYAPFTGIEVLHFSKRWYWQGKLLGKIEGEVARKMIDRVKTSKENYSYTKKYSLGGINSNSYVRWILKHFAEVDVKLPWNSFGKNVE